MMATTWALWNATDYAKAIGPIEEREWTVDVQPKSERHMLQVSWETARYLARKAIGGGGALGSQFGIAESYSELQTIGGEQIYIFPLDYSGYTIWTAAGGVPGYVKVYGEDHKKPAELVMAGGDGFLYTPGAFFGYNLDRHLRSLGYLAENFTNRSMEIDEEGKAWWVITLYKPTVGWSGERATGVLVVDPTTGTVTEYDVGKAPEWVDLVFPADFAEQYVAWWGLYREGWWNAFWDGIGLLEPEPPLLVYGSDNQPWYVLGLTSTNEKDDSLVGLFYFQSKTGRAVKYDIKGGGTHVAILEAVAKNQQVQYKHLRGAAIQIYNIHGEPSAFVSLVNDIGAFQGIAIVHVGNVQDVAVGEDVFQAVVEYGKLLRRSGQIAVADKGAEVATAIGSLERIAASCNGTGTTYYFMLAGSSTIFTAEESSNPEIVLSKAGDVVSIEFYKSDQMTVPAISFDNTSMTSQLGVVEGEVRKHAEERIGG